MEYESKLYIVEKSSCYDSELEKVFAQIICMYNLSNTFPEFKHFINECLPTDCYIYIDSKRTIKDEYDSPLVELPIKDLLEVLVQETKHEDKHYHSQLMPLIALLKVFKSRKNIAILHYGY
ncbi:MAG: hypothetical protein WC516_06665 [Patescibacteria group bacterium]|jgi:hypothetical protein